MILAYGQIGTNGRLLRNPGGPRCGTQQRCTTAPLRNHTTVPEAPSGVN